MQSAVGFVAVQAIFHHGRMFPEQWTAFSSVTAVTGFVKRGSVQHPGCQRTMWLVTIRAGHQSLTYRMGERAHSLGSNRYMTAITHPGLFGFCAYRIALGMDTMTVNTYQIGSLMCTSRPVCLDLPRYLVTAQADGAGFFPREMGIRCKSRNRGPLLSTANATRVRSGGSMTGLAL